MNDRLIRAVKRFLRVVVPQVPTLIAFATGNPTYEKFVPLLVLFGAILTSLDKYVRDVYGEKQ